MVDIGKDLQKAYDEGYEARDSEIVRCKDCKWWIEHGCEPEDKTIIHKCVEFDCFLAPNDFCSYGEKRENESNL